MIEFKQGYKGTIDKKVFINGHQITFLELAECVLQLYLNEDNIYPPLMGYRGGQMLLDFIIEVCKTKAITPEIKKRYKL